jgi:hypothetical protein
LVGSLGVGLAVYLFETRRIIKEDAAPFYTLAASHFLPPGVEAVGPDGVTVLLVEALRGRHSLIVIGDPVEEGAVLEKVAR